MSTDFDKIQDIPPGELDLNQPETQSVIDDTIRVSRQTTEAVNNVEDRMDTAESDIDTLEANTIKATKAEMEDKGTDESEIAVVSPSNLRDSFLIPKVLCSIDVSGGTYTLDSGDSFNVSSLNKTGTGVLEINFTTAFSNTNYIWAGNSALDSGGNASVPAEDSRTTSKLTVSFGLRSTGGLVDPEGHVGIMIFGDQ